MGALSGIMAVVLMHVPLLWMRVRHEERILTETLGSRYNEYRKSVPAFLPLPWTKGGQMR